jgi:glycerophosphoryl diester phosphodiesterase
LNGAGSADSGAAVSARPLVIAHRGVHSTGATENTLQAFEAAVERGADMIELDVRRTAAGELAVLHDHRLGEVALDSCSLDEFEQRTGFRPPLLTDVLAWAEGRIGLDVELKEDGYAEQIAPLLSEFAAAGNELIVTSFLDPLLAQLTAIAPGLRLGLLLMWTAEGAGQRAGAAGARTVLPEMKLVDEPLIEAVTSAGLELIVWDFMAADHAQLLSDERVTGVITDDVSAAMAARGRLGFGDR